MEVLDTQRKMQKKPSGQILECMAGDVKFMQMFTLLFLLCLLCCLCGFPADLLYWDGLYDSHSNCLPHVTYSEPSQRWEVGECLYTHARTPVLLLDVCKLAGDMRCVTVQHGSVAIRDLSGMVEYNNLSSEVCRGLRWFVLTVACHV